MGFNPNRQHRRNNLDYVYVAVGSAAVVALIVWAFFG